MTRTMPQLQMDNATKKTLKHLEALCESIDAKALFGKDLSNYALEILAVNSIAMKRLNATHLGKNQTTDVLSFPLLYDEINATNAPFTPLLGSIVINTTLAKKMAQALGHSFEVEVSVLFIHGFLHILGFNHESDNGEQRAMEVKILTSLNLATQGLIDRV